MNPSLEASWSHPWRQDLHTEADGGPGVVFRGAHGCQDSISTNKRL
ncbi:hypothetical protein [Halorhodospira halochloris]|nr:hypothetical protein [Halorhodospira halochloris]